MKKQYILSIDQSTQGTKGLLFDREGRLLCRSDLPHRQIVDEHGWVSHDPEEIYQNLLQCVRNVVHQAGISPEALACVGLSNQRETALAWERGSGRPVCDAVVWQCSRSSEICERLAAQGHGDWIRQRTGIPLSPYYPATKLLWILENIPGARKLADAHELCMGTVDTWLIYKLTGAYKTDYSNASRTQLFDIVNLRWDAELCSLLDIHPDDLAEVCDSDSVFGMTDFDGFLKEPIPVCGVLGDSHGALFGQGCLERGGLKVTYGTGSSVMLNIGEKPVFSTHGAATSLAWRWRGKTQYVMEGNINYTGAVVNWMQEIGLVSSAKETQALAEQANPEDTTYLIPAFTGLGAPHWDSSAQAMLYGMTRQTGRAELVKAGVECIAYQIADVLHAIEQDFGEPVRKLNADGGATKNTYLMQFQSDLMNAAVDVPEAEELSGIGAAYMAGLSCGIYNDSVFSQLRRAAFTPQMPEAQRQQRYRGWCSAIGKVMHH